MRGGSNVLEGPGHSGPHSVLTENGRQRNARHWPFGDVGRGDWVFMALAEAKKVFGKLQKRLRLVAASSYFWFLSRIS